jgi:SAM-dependent methyltransferase
MKTVDLPHIRVPDDMTPGEMPDLLRYWYLGSKARHHLMLRRFLQVDVEVGSSSVDRVLDIGSAWGYNVMVLAKLGKTAIGMDLVVDQFAAGSRIAAANGLGLPVVGADACCLPFGRAEFAGVTMVETFEHIFDEDRGRAVAECFRVLRPGGRIILSTPNHGSFVERLKRMIVRVPWLRRRLPTMCYPVDDVARSDYHPYRYHRPDPAGKIAGLLEGHGFKVLKVKYFLFVLKNTPDWFFPVVALLEGVLERTPGVNRLAATVCIVGEKP